MSIADELNKVVDELTEAYDAIEEMGGIVPAEKNYKNLRIAIESISPGPMANAYAILYTPNSDLEPDWTEDANDIRAIMNGSSYLPNSKGHTNLKFTERCQELTDITSIGNSGNGESTATTLSQNIRVVEGLSNFTSVTNFINYFMGNPRVQSTLEEITDWPPNVTTIGNYFLYQCVLYRSPIDTSKFSRIGSYFLAGCSVFNQPIDLSGLQSLSNFFLTGCASFDYPLDFSNLNELPTNTMRDMSSFNSPVNLSGMTRIGSNCFRGLPLFNQQLDLSEVTYIGGTSFVSCTSFNQPIKFPKLEYCGGILNGCDSFNQPLIFPESLTRYSIGALLFGANNFTSTITVNTTKNELEEWTNQLSLSATSASAPMYIQGVRLTGPGAMIWKESLPDLYIPDAGAFGSAYRKIIVA